MRTQDIILADFLHRCAERHINCTYLALKRNVNQSSQQSLVFKGQSSLTSHYLIIFPLLLVSKFRNLQATAKPVFSIKVISLNELVTVQMKAASLVLLYFAPINLPPPPPTHPPPSDTHTGSTFGLLQSVPVSHGVYETLRTIDHPLISNVEKKIRIKSTQLVLSE